MGEVPLYTDDMLHAVNSAREGPRTQPSLSDQAVRPLWRRQGREAKSFGPPEYHLRSIKRLTQKKKEEAPGS